MNWTSILPFLSLVCFQTEEYYQFIHFSNNMCCFIFGCFYGSEIDRTITHHFSFIKLHNLSPSLIISPFENICVIFVVMFCNVALNHGNCLPSLLLPHAAVSLFTPLPQSTFVRWMPTFLNVHFPRPVFVNVSIVLRDLCPITLSTTQADRQGYRDISKRLHLFRKLKQILFLLWRELWCLKKLHISSVLGSLPNNTSLSKCFLHALLHKIKGQ